MLRRALPVTHELALFGIAATRTIEQREAAALAPFTLMARAGDATARLALAIAPHAERIWVAAGPGHNGGDGLEAASLLQGRHGKQVVVTLIGDPAALPADAATAWRHAQDAGVMFTDSVPDPASDDAPELAIDALLGIGARRAAQGTLEAAILRLNALACPVLAVDVPSGLNADTGQATGACVAASHTLTMLGWKPGLFTGSGRDHAGHAWLADLEVDTGADAPSAWLAGAPAHVPRRHAQHKGSFGDVAVVGGGPGMTGAALLAARAAHAAGAGRVFVELLDPHAPAFDGQRPELMLRRGWHAAATPAVLGASTVVAGCGGGDAVRRALPRLLSLARRLVLDADALNAVAHDVALLPLLHARAGRGLATVLTPHPLEAARLLGVTTAQVQADRLHAANALAAHCRAVVVLKGSGSVIAAPGQTPRVNSTGNAALATAGSGDVLAGWLGGRWAPVAAGDESAGAFRAAIDAVAEHGAGAEPAPSGVLRAGDLIERLVAR